MDAAHWKRVWELFDAVVELPHAERTPTLESMEPDPALRDEVQRLLAAEDTPTAVPGPTPASKPMLAPGTHVGPWQVASLLGRGGMGEVYLVHRTGADFQQRGALKLLLRMQSQEDRDRFAAERRILARLEHPAIAHLLDGSEYQGTPYAVLEYVDGVPLTEYAANLPLRERLLLMLQACDAVGHAHRHLVVHRDLKPGNILVTANGQLKLLDFGIAKKLHSEPGLPEDATQVIRASPDYCAPEQLNGGAISTATDVYALGVILFELLTGERPWKLGGLPLMRALERLALQDPPRPSSRVRGAGARMLRGDLDNIVRKALQPDPEQRYRTTDELAADIRAHLDQRPVKARKPTLAYLATRMFRRHWAAVTLAGVAAVAVAAGITGVVLQGRKAAIERDYAQRQVVRNNAVRQYLMLMFRAAGDLQGEGDMTARDVLARAAAQVSDEFSNDPAAYADISLALAELFFQLNDYTGARPLLERLVNDPATGGDVLAMAHHDLAQISFRENRMDEAVELLAKAQSFWQDEPRAYASELLASRLLQSQLERSRGDVDQALHTLETALPQRIALSGPEHRETAVLVNNLGTLHFETGRLEDAVARFREAHALWQALGQDRSADALNTLNNWAVAETRLNRPEQAVDIMQQALALRRELYGPSAAMAALLNNLGKTLSQLERHAEAVPLLEEAIAMGRKHAGGENGLIALSASLGLADALTGTGQPQPAHALIDEVRDRIVDAFGPGHTLAAMADISRARAHRAAGAIRASNASLARARSALTAQGPAGAGALQQLDQLESLWAAAGSSGRGTLQAGAAAQPASE